MAQLDIQPDLRSLDEKVARWLGQIFGFSRLVHRPEGTPVIISCVEAL
jgi:hypothetical protein